MSEQPTNARAILQAATREREAAKSIQKCIDELLAVPQTNQPTLLVKVFGVDTKISLITWIAHVNVMALIADAYAVEVARHDREADRLEARVQVVEP
jgi:hypothetical protein